MGYSREQMSVLVEQVRRGSSILLGEAEDVKRLDNWVRELTDGKEVVHINVRSDYYEATIGCRLDKTQDVYVSLDADHIVHLRSVLSYQHTSLYRQIRLFENSLGELEQDLEDVHLLERKIAVERVTRQDMETLEMIENELEEIHKPI
jgi:ABC-type branched-subunit amino acid transport system ATPase component